MTNQHQSTSTSSDQLLINQNRGIPWASATKYHQPLCTGRIPTFERVRLISFGHQGYRVTPNPSRLCVINPFSIVFPTFTNVRYTRGHWPAAGEPPCGRLGFRLHGVHELKQHRLQFVDATSYCASMDVDGRHGHRLLTMGQLWMGKGQQAPASHSSL